MWAERPRHVRGLAGLTPPLVAEAEYDVAELKRRGRGRPGRGAEPMQVVVVRLTAEELEALDAAAECLVK